MLFRKLNLDWRYAITELVIVIAGVLIALAADGCAEQRSERELERRYLTDLATDLGADTTEVNNVIALAESRALLGHAVLRAIDEDTVLNAGELAAAVERQMYFTYPAYSRATISDLMSTGNLRLITDQALKRRLSEYYQTIERLEQWSGNWRQIQMDMERLLPELLDIRQREGLLHESAPTAGFSGPTRVQSFPWAPRFEITEEEGLRILQRLRAHPEARARIEGMIRIQATLYGQLLAIKSRAAETLEAVESALGAP